jgi:hypothetical protein
VGFLETDWFRPEEPDVVSANPFTCRYRTTPFSHRGPSPVALNAAATAHVTMIGMRSEKRTAVRRQMLLIGVVAIVLLGYYGCTEWRWSTVYATKSPDGKRQIDVQQTACFADCAVRVVLRDSWRSTTIASASDCWKCSRHLVDSLSPWAAHPEKDAADSGRSNFRAILGSCGPTTLSGWCERISKCRLLLKFPRWQPEPVATNIRRINILRPSHQLPSHG